MLKKTLLLTGLSTLFINNVVALPDNYLCSDNATYTGFDHLDSGWYSITSGKTMGDVTVPNSGSSSGCLDVQADRSNSSSNVTWVQTGMESQGVPWQSNYMAGSLTYFDSMPSALNFAIFGTLSISIKNVEYSCPNVYIGEGSNIQGYNWWLFYNTQGGIACYNKANNDNVIISAVSAYAYPFNSSTNQFHFSVSNN